MEWVLVGAGVLIVGIVAWTARDLVRSRRLAREGQANLDDAQTRGVEPVSLHPWVDPSKCVGTGACVRSCPEVDVLAVIRGQAKLANPTSCIGHGECAVACPVDAITLVMGTEQRGVELPVVKGNFETTVPGLFVAGELGGMGLIYNAVTQGLQCMEGIAKKAPKPVPGAHQVVVVGAGPAGLAASVAAKAAKLDCVTVDQESVGGTVLQYPRQKIVMTRPFKLPLYGKVQLSTVSKESLLELWEDILAKTGVEVRTGVKVEGVARGDDGIFTVSTTSGPIRAQRVVLALGRRGSPRKLDVPGEDKAKVMYRLLEPENYRGTRCLVIGGGDSAVESALALGEAGAEVTLSYRQAVFSRAKKKNLERLEQARASGLIKVRTESRTLEILDDRVRLKGTDGEVELPNDYVMIFAGGVLPTALLEGAGVEVDVYAGEAFAPAN